MNILRENNQNNLIYLKNNHKKIIIYLEKILRVEEHFSIIV